MATDHESRREDLRRDGYHPWRGFLDRRVASSLRREVAGVRRDGTATVENLPGVAAVTRDPVLGELVRAVLGRSAEPVVEQWSASAERAQWQHSCSPEHLLELVRGNTVGLRCLLVLKESDEPVLIELMPVPRFPRSDTAPPPEPVAFTGRAGDLLILAAATWHRIGVTADREDVALSLTYLARQPDKRQTTRPAVRLRGI